jgi:hypothetical protein
MGTAHRTFRGHFGGGRPASSAKRTTDVNFQRGSLFQARLPFNAKTAEVFPHPRDKKRMILRPFNFCSEREFNMKRVLGFLTLLMVLAPAVFAQEHYTEGPVWRIQLIRVKPTKMDAYLTSLRQSTKPFIEEQKKQGMITDYKVFLKQTKNSPDDWDICVAIQYKNWAALDGAAAKGEAVRDKILGGKPQALELNDKRAEIREIISSELLQEIVLK